MIENEIREMLMRDNDDLNKKERVKILDEFDRLLRGGEDD